MNTPRDKAKFWFPAKTYGYGWGPPVCWQGWMVMLVYVALLVAGAVFIARSPENVVYFTLYAVGLSCCLVFVCWLKGEKAGWRWGEGKQR